MLACRRTSPLPLPLPTTRRPPPPPPPGPYGAPPAAPGSGWNLGDALSYGWTKFQANVGQILLAALALFVVVGVIAAIGFGIQAALLDNGSVEFDPETGALTSDAGSGFVTVLVVNALVSALILVGALIVSAGIIRAALGLTEGRDFKVSDVLSTDRLGPILVTSLLVAALTFVGTLLCYLPGLVVGFATSYSLFFVIDKGLAPVEAIKASVDLVRHNLGDTLIWYIVGGLVAGAGAIACGVGLLVTVPLVLIGTAYTYKKLTGQPVAA